MSRMNDHQNNLPPGVKQSDIDIPSFEPEWTTCPACKVEIYAGDIKTCRDCNRDGCKKCMRKCRSCKEFVCPDCWTKDFKCKQCQEETDSSTLT